MKNFLDFVLSVILVGVALVITGAIAGMGVWLVGIGVAKVAGHLGGDFRFAFGSLETYVALGIVLLVVLQFGTTVLEIQAGNEPLADRLAFVVMPSLLAGALVYMLIYSARSPAWWSYVPLALVAAIAALGTHLSWSGALVRWASSKTAGRVGTPPVAQPGQPATPEGEAFKAPVIKPRAGLASIFGNEAIKTRLREAAMAITARRSVDSKPRNGILLHGLPGNGKTAFAEALAGELGLPLISLGYSDVVSKWVGWKTQRVTQVFAQAKAAAPCVLFLDEIDSFLESRDGRQDGLKEDRDLTNALLTMMVDIRQHRVILIGATNHMDRLDAAAVREGRFDFKVEITPPDEAARVGLLRKGLQEHVPGLRAADSVIESVARRWNGFSVKRILAVTEELTTFMKGRGPDIGFDDFMGALRQLQGQRGAAPENVKKLAELVLDTDTREALDLIVGRMADPEHTERHGGTLPTGVLFSGPPGTGKTATCKALAAELGWAFLPATGADFARDPRKLEALYAKAQDLRPAIVFIDEADELLRSREYSPSTEATNKLLTLMDGVGDRVRDVIWIAATNHPDQVDSALLRGGRFAEKVVFKLPSPEALVGFVRDWMQRRNVALDDALDPSAVAQAIGSLSIADAEAVLQGALNRAVARRVSPVQVKPEDIKRAIVSLQPV